MPRVPRLSPAQRETARRLAGRTIARVILRPFAEANGGGAATDPVIVFTDGTRLGFMVRETEDEYGVDLVYSGAKPRTEDP